MGGSRRTMMRLCLAVVLVVALAQAGDVAELGESNAVISDSCMEGKRAMDTICEMYGKSSKDCGAVAKAHESKGCGDMGESKMLVSNMNTNCADFNKNDPKLGTKVLCDAAKIVCNVPKMDYCTDKLHKVCFQSIGQGCPGKAKAGNTRMQDEQQKANKAAADKAAAKKSAKDAKKETVKPK